MSGQMNKYDEDFKKSIVNLFHGGKTQTQLSKEYGISMSAIGKWIKMFSEVKIDNARSSPLTKSKLFRNVMPSLRRKTSY